VNTILNPTTMINNFVHRLVQNLVFVFLILFYIYKIICSLLLNLIKGQNSHMVNLTYMVFNISTKFYHQGIPLQKLQ